MIRKSLVDKYGEIESAYPSSEEFGREGCVQL